MPLYEYQCRKCRRRTEKIEAVSGPHLKKCPHCGASVERLLGAPAIQFKGAGWYVTDYGKERRRHGKYGHGQERLEGNLERNDQRACHEGIQRQETSEEEGLESHSLRVFR